MAESVEKSLNKTVGQLEDVLEEYLVKKAPGLPDNIRELLVNLAPWLAIVGVVISIPAILALVGLKAVMGPAMMYGYGYGMGRLGAMYWVGMVFWIVSVVLQAMAIPGLFKRKRSAWMLMFYAMILNALYSLVTFNIGGFVIGGLIGFYLLFQVKKYYK